MAEKDSEMDRYTVAVAIDGYRREINAFPLARRLLLALRLILGRL